jgi:hypothetical protein
MKDYRYTIRVFGYRDVTVTAANQDEAVKKAVKRYDIKGKIVISKTEIRGVEKTK